MANDEESLGWCYNGAVMNKLRVSILLLLGFVTLAGISLSQEEPISCREPGTYLFVDTSTKKLSLCNNLKSLKTFSVALGQNGVDKYVEGDKKTPIGSYSLSSPRSSERFGLFIPVEYPTEEQRKEGRTGGEIGVHGPPRYAKWLGDLTTWVNWTKGCIAVGSDAAIREVAEWVQNEGVTRIVIR